MDNCPKKSGTLRSHSLFLRDEAAFVSFASTPSLWASAFPARRGAIRKKYYRKGGILQNGKKSNSSEQKFY